MTVPIVTHSRRHSSLECEMYLLWLNCTHFTKCNGNNGRRENRFHCKRIIPLGQSFHLARNAVAFVTIGGGRRFIREMGADFFVLGDNTRKM